MSKVKLAWLATSALAGGLLLSSAAFAQSTGSQELEAVVVSAGGAPNQNGVIVLEREAKSRATINKEYITTQNPGQTILQSLNIVPGFNFTNNDPFGSAGGDLTVRGFDSQRVALLQDGVPLNDSGNYAIYPNQQLEPDLIERATVNLGTTDVDSPTAAAAGGTINYITRKASDTFGGRFEVGGGQDNFQRYYGTIETGAFGPFGTKAWFSGLYTSNDLFKPHFAPRQAPGGAKKKQFNARIDQDFGNGNFISIIGNYNENRLNFINRISLANYNTRNIQPYNPTCARPVFVGGTAQVDNCASYVGQNINPSNTGNLRILSRFNLTDQLTLTVDPSFQYVLANGGGAQAFRENDPQFRGNVDLSGDGDTLDTVFLYRPNTTNTRRYGVTSSLIWRWNDKQSIRVAYTFDRAKHRQTGEAGPVDANGDPLDVFGGKDGYGPPILLPDGTQLRRRDRSSVALLNQAAIEYRGRYFDDKLMVNAGLRAPFLKRDLTNFCYQRDTFNALCTTQVGTPVAGTDDGTGRPLVTFPVSTLNPSAANRYGQPRHFERKYDKVLPNAGVSYDFTPSLQVYASYAETLSAPRTDDLYDQILVDPGPEKAQAFDLGARFKRGPFLAAGAVWKNSFSNRIERVFDDSNPNITVAFSRNVGDVHLWGLDGQLGYEPIKELSVYATVSYIASEIQDDIPGTSNAGALATKGKSLYETPKWQGGVRVRFDPDGPFSMGVQGKFVGERWTNLVNDEKFPGYTLWDADVRLDLSSMLNVKNTYLQANVLNLFDERYIGDMTPNASGTALGQPGYRQTFTLTLHSEF